MSEDGRVAWGPALIGSAPRTNDERVRAAVPEQGEAASRHFRLRFGAASLDGSQVLLYVERIEPRAKAGRLPEPSGPRVRWVITDAALELGGPVPGPSNYQGPLGRQCGDGVPAELRLSSGHPLGPGH